MKKSKILCYLVLFFMSNFNIIFVSNAYGGLFGGFYRRNGLVNGPDKYKNIHQEPEEQSGRSSASRRPLKRNTYDEPELKRSNFYKKDGLVNNDQQFKDKHVVEEPVKTIVYSRNGMVKSKVTVGYATNKRLKPISTGSLLDVFRFSSKRATRQTVDSPR
jgi:hypothetical protein